MTIDEILDIPPYSLSSEEKKAMLDKQLSALTVHHAERCPSYRRILQACGVTPGANLDYTTLPMLPVRMFKEHDLLSCSPEEVIKTMTSSGTSGQRTSRIYLDRTTSSLQTRCLTKIVSNFIGTRRVPMIVLDTASVIKNRAMFSARGAGILGFSMFGSKRIYALNENMELDIDGMRVFLDEHSDAPVIFLFGFTFMIWQHFYKKLLESGFRPDLSRAILIHGGGWKKLENERISSLEFRQRLQDVCGISPAHIHDYYGMVEQTGSIYLECKEGHLHAPIFSDVIIRRPLDFSIAATGERGIIEVISVIPESYPGHVLLTEDEGMILGEDDCPCGRKGKYFKIFGRLKNAEIRGCSDTYAAKF